MAIPSHRSSAIQDTLLRCRRQFLAVGLFSLCVNVLMLTSSLYMMQVYDRVLASGSTETLVLLTVIALGALGVMAALDAVRSRVLGRLGTWSRRIWHRRPSPAVLRPPCPTCPTGPRRCAISA
jgi:ABC-type protease/lipase transport system fused ATPase/permease subunit